MADAKEDENKPPPSQARPRAGARVVQQGVLPHPAAPAPAIGEHIWPRVPTRRAAVPYAMSYYLSQTEWWPAERLAMMQLHQATALVRFAQKLAPRYRDRLAPVVDGMGEGLTPESFRAIPFLTRADVQAAGASLFSTSLPQSHGATFDLHTTGSTGEPVHVKSTNLASMINIAITLRGHQWFRRDLASSNVTIKVVSGEQKKIRARTWAAGSTGPSHIYSNLVPVGQLFRWLLRDDPHYLQCHPSILQELIHCSRDAGETPKRLREVRSMGEVLDPALRALCQRQ